MDKQQAAGFNLSEDDVQKLLGECLKPEEISGEAAVQLDRIKELMHWFRRSADGKANPKWFRAHAFELAYYIATSAGNRSIDLEAVRKRGWLEGVSLPPSERAFGEKHGFIPPTIAPPAAGPVWVKLEDGFPDLNVRRLGSKESITVLVSQGTMMDWAKYISQDTGGKGWVGCHWTPTHWAYIPLPNESGGEVFTREQVEEIVYEINRKYVQTGITNEFVRNYAKEYMNTNYPKP